MGIFRQLRVVVSVVVQFECEPKKPAYEWQVTCRTPFGEGLFRSVGYPVPFAD
jgi:hypothetical protein